MQSAVAERIRKIQDQIDAQERETANLREMLNKERQQINTQNQARDSPMKTYSASHNFTVFEEAANYTYEHEASSPELPLKGQTAE